MRRARSVCSDAKDHAAGLSGLVSGRVGVFAALLGPLMGRRAQWAHCTIGGVGQADCSGGPHQCDAFATLAALWVPQDHRCIAAAAGVSRWDIRWVVRAGIRCGGSHFASDCQTIVHTVAEYVWCLGSLNGRLLKQAASQMSCSVRLQAPRPVEAPSSGGDYAVTACHRFGS
jgi:hypothetical protein